MPARLAPRLPLPCLVAALALSSSPPAVAAPACRASVARVTGGESPQLATEPIRANAAAGPCSRQSATALAPTHLDALHLDAATAVTDVVPGAAGGSANATTSSVMLPGLMVKTGALAASAAARCAGGATVLEGASSVTGLVVNGQSIDVPADGGPLALDLSPAITVRVNASTEQNGVLTRRAVEVNAGGVSVVLGEAVAGGDACEAGAPGETASPGSSAGGTSAGGMCPAGSSYDPQRGVCVISAGADNNSTAREVEVGRAFTGPAGGEVVELRTARERYGAAGGCLTGSGPGYAIIGTQGDDRVTGTDRADRLIMRSGNDRVSGGRGGDCVYGGAGRDILAGAQGADRIIGGTGNDALDGGSDSDRLSGGAGRDTINAGFGRDVVRGGAGSDAINVATAGPAARTIDCGSGRDKARINRNERRRARGCEIVYRIR